MALYEYRCAEHGPFDALYPLGHAPATAACPHCSAPSTRVITAPMVLGSKRLGWNAAIEHADKSRHEPEVVSSLPSAGKRRMPRVATLTPQLMGLPRP